MHKTGTREQWLAERLELLKAEKELTRQSDELARRRQELVPYVSSHLSGVARRNGCANGSTAEADATRAHLNHDGSVRQRFSNCEAKSQSANRATSPQKGNESAGVDSIIKGNCGPVPLIGQFWTVATNAKLPVIV
jgi:Bacterial protein of unknown function (DUF899)